MGASVDTYSNHYGIVAEDDITIQMRRDKLALAAELRPQGGPIATLRAQLASTDYQHQEINGDGAVGTTFKTRGRDGRLEAVHRAVALGAGRLEATLGLQIESSRLSALGAEAFVPSTQTQQSAAFMLERWTFGSSGHLSAGLRAERVTIQSEGDVDPAAAQFGPAQARSFSPRSASLGAVLNLSSQWQLSSNAAYTERAPTSYELFANGVHAATSAYERGDPLQAKERGRNLDLAMGWRQGAHHVKLAAFDSRFANYMVLSATGEPDFVSAANQRFPVFAFRGVRAHLYGLEADAVWRALATSWVVDMDIKLDVVRGTQLDNGEPLPRLAPRRATVGLNLTQGAWTLRAEVQHASAQSRVPATDTRTAGWRRVNLSASHALSIGGRDVLLFARLQNLNNTLAYSASTSRTVRALTPLPARGLAVGLRLGF